MEKISSWMISLVSALLDSSPGTAQLLPSGSSLVSCLLRPFIAMKNLVQITKKNTWTLGQVQALIDPNTICWVISMIIAQPLVVHRHMAIGNPIDSDHCHEAW